MNLSVQIKEAFTNICSAKLRTTLAVLGILVGTASVVAMVSGGELATRQALQQFKNLGTDLLAISINSTDQGGASDSQAKLSLDTALHLKSASPDIIEVAPYTNVYTSMSYQGKKVAGGIIGATDDLARVMKLKARQGRFVSFLDKYSFYCVLGDSVYQKIKPYTQNVIGKQIKLGSEFFTIVGVIKHTSANASFIYANLNNSIFVPLEASRLLNKYTDIYNIVVKLRAQTDIPTVEDKIKGYFKTNTVGKQLYMRSAKQFISGMKKQRAILTIFLGFVGGIALIVGGIGVMNIMLVSVTERRREIGIRLAIGAKRRDIQSLFLVESIILSLFGGAMGVIIGVLISYVIATVKHWGFILFFDPPLVGFSVSVLIGVVSGFYPAYKASKLDPIQTLRAD